MSDSIKVDGLLNPIFLRPNPATPGRFILVAGKHRFFATKNVLKEQYIRATIQADMGETEASLASDVENLWRNPLTRAQHAGALKRWHAHWLSQVHAEHCETKTHDAIDHNDKSDSGKSVRVAKSTPKTEAEFDQRVASATGQGEATVRRAKAIANAFTHEQLEILGMVGASQADMLTIAKIKDINRRGEVVALIASGVDVEVAIKQVMGSEAPTRYNETKVADETKKATKTAKAQKAPELTDNEWFEQNCGEKAAMLGHPGKFKTDSLLYRAISEIRHQHRAKVKGDLSGAKKAGSTGPFFNLVNRYLSISHPKDWFLCIDCKGKGTIGSASIGESGSEPAPKCPKCYGGGYLLKTEEYL